MKRVQVVKVGGSLLELPNLASRLQEWLAQQSPAHQVLLVGGGTLVEEVRQCYSHEPLCEVPAHWLAIDLMTVTTRALQRDLPAIPQCEDFDRLTSQLSKVGATFFAPFRWLHKQESQQAGTTLPASWEVTSDSIAARLAVVLQADELVLLKSALPPADKLSEMAELGYVDRMLPRLEPELPAVRFANFRSERLQG